ncbi:MAG: hypothetical protein AAGD35_13910 [Actinomycetota bacterium]
MSQPVPATSDGGRRLLLIGAVVVLLALVVLSAAWLLSDDDGSTPDGAAPTAEEVAEAEEAEEAALAIGGPPVDRGEMLAIVDDVNTYWDDVAQDLDIDYTPVPADQVWFGPDGPTCDGEPIDEDDVEGNAFVDSGCAEGIIVALDPDYVGASTARAEATIAHEWGHVVQAQATEVDLSLDPDGLPIDGELQADCFAGAWAADRAVSSLADLRADVATTGDLGEVDIEDPDAHGTAEERTAAFDLGAERGPAACIDDIVETLP